MREYNKAGAERFKVGNDSAIPTEGALGGDCRVFVPEVSLAGRPKSSLQGGIHGVLRNKYPIGAMFLVGTIQAPEMLVKLAFINVLESSC